MLPAVLLAAVVVLAEVVAGSGRRVQETDHLDPQSAIYWPDARLAYDPEPNTGPIMDIVYYTVAPERQAAFLEAMGQLRRSRLRTGATRWDLYQDEERPDQFVELFSVPSWEEHLRQHAGRLTAADREIEQTTHAFSDPPPWADHLLPPQG